MLARKNEDDASDDLLASPDDLLPAVQPPSAGFLLQLFLIPLLIVSVIVMVWLMFSWLASAGSDPRELVRDLKKLNNSSWQKAVSLANQLQDPQYDALKDDAALATDLAQVLDAELAAGQTDSARLMLRVYLCRILGEFRVGDGMPALLKAAEQEKTKEEVDVRAAALESLAILIKNLGPEKMRESKELRAALLDCSAVTPTSGGDESVYAEVRSRAAFALGVLGGEEATSRLEQMLADAYPNARYNAAVGLARQGDFRCKNVLLEMLDPQNPEVVKSEELESNREAKRLSVLVNGLRAAEVLLLNPPSPDHQADFDAVRAAVVRLSEASEPKAVPIVARDVLRNLELAPANAGAAK